MKVLVDMRQLPRSAGNLTPAWVLGLRTHGVDAVHWSEVGDPRSPDADLMQYAREQGYVVFTHDLDFGVLLALTRAAGPSVLQLRAQSVMPEESLDIVLAVLRDHDGALTAGALITIDDVAARVRILPLR